VMSSVRDIEGCYCLFIKENNLKVQVIMIGGKKQLVQEVLITM
ncbi:hypothetical protein THOM_3013, partial [Trachipleistophora hominis]